MVKQFECGHIYCDELGKKWEVVCKLFDDKLGERLLLKKHRPLSRKLYTAYVDNESRVGDGIIALIPLRKLNGILYSDSEYFERW